MIIRDQYFTTVVISGCHMQGIDESQATFATQLSRRLEVRTRMRQHNEQVRILDQASSRLQRMSITLSIGACEHFRAYSVGDEGSKFPLCAGDQKFP